MQAGSELGLKLMSLLKVHRELTPDCYIFRHARGSQSVIQGFPWKRESITLHWFPAFAGTSLDSRLRTAGMTTLIYVFFMQRLGKVCKIPLIPLSQRGIFPCIPLFGKEG
jgi:hypothetical protein